MIYWKNNWIYIWKIPLLYNILVRLLLVSALIKVMNAKTFVSVLDL